MILRTAISVLITLVFAGCASITTPTGGPKDKHPPLLMESSPTPKQLNFKSKSIQLTFDEDIKLNNAKEEIIISPSPGKEIEFKAKGKRVTIEPKESWKDSTTYSIAFREGIQDITENNSPPNLKLAFSTGPIIDSLHLAGKVHDILDGGPREKITVAIFDSDTFDIFSHTPSYFTKTDKRGVFLLENIKAGTYRIYAFDDKNKNLKVESRNEVFGFITKKIVLHASVDTLSIGLFRLDSRPLKINSIRNSGPITRIRFNKYINEYSVKGPDITHSFADDQTEIVLWNPEGDSVQLQLSAADSIKNKVDTSFYIKRTRLKPIPWKFKWSLGSPTVDPETGKMTTVVTVNKPVRNINFDSLYIQIDTTERVGVTARDLVGGPQANNFTLTKMLNKKLFGPEKDPHLTLVAGTGFLSTVDDDTTKLLFVPAIILWPEENAVLSFEVSTSKKNYLIQIMEVTTRKIVNSYSNAPRMTVKNLQPSMYRIRAVLDTNNNGKWDPGDFKKGIEPERIVYYTGEKESPNIPLRANWEIGPLTIKF